MKITRPWIVQGSGCCVIAMALSLPAQAQTGLAQLFSAAWQRQPEALTAAAHREAAEGRQASARSWTAEPASLEIVGKTDRLQRNDGARELELGIAAPLWWPGERGHAQALAAAELGAVDSRVAAAQWRLAGTVREAWWAWQRAELDLGLAQARVEQARQLGLDVVRRVAAGDLSRADQHQAEAAIAAAQAELAEALAGQAQARFALQALSGGLPDTAVGSEPAPVGDESLDGHPALSELQDRARLARHARELAGTQSRANPELSLSTTRERGARSEAYGQTITLGLRIPFGSDGQRKTQLATAGAAQIEAEAQLMLGQQRLAAELATARARLSACEAVAQSAARRAVLARETLGFVDKAFGLGETDLPTRLRAAQEAFEAQRQSERASLGQQQALSNLRQALGLLPQ